MSPARHPPSPHGFWLRRLMLLVIVVAIVAAAASAFEPVRTGADRVLKPPRDLVGWIGDSLDAKREGDELTVQHDALRNELTRLQAQGAENDELTKIVRLNATAGLSRYAPLQARVTGRAPASRPRQIQVDQGSSDGVRAGQPVLNGDGLVGHVTRVGPESAVATLIDTAFAAGVVVQGTDIRATATSSVNRPGELELTLVNALRISPGDVLITTGTTSPDTPSFYAPGIPVGRVASIDHGDGTLDTRIRVRPTADLMDLDRVEILTAVDGV